ncbi:hypothetical protein [Sphingomonas sp.]|jgi:hypothetical protein|uniref:hypothetical protein n=1 Tax=Sphingomonas sp. TaxID=28214 RepID=UPI002ED96C8F
MDGDPFETVAIAYSQPQAGVILSLFAWHGMLAYAMNLETARTNCPWTLALGGIPIRVERSAAEEARALLTEAADRSGEPQVETASGRISNGVIAALCFVMAGAAPPPRLSASIVRR